MPKELPPAEPKRATGSVTKPTLELDTYKRKELEQVGLRPVRQLSRMCIDTIVKNFQSEPRALTLRPCAAASRPSARPQWTQRLNIRLPGV